MPTSKGPRKGKRKSGRPAPTRIPVTLNMDHAMRESARTAYYLAVDALAAGRATTDDVHVIANAVQLAFVLREIVEDTDDAVTELMAGGLSAVRRVYGRHEATGKWGVSGDELGKIRDALGLADELLGVASRREVRDAARLVAKYNSNGARLEDR